MLSRDFRDRLIWIAMNDVIFFGVAWLAYRHGQLGGFFLFFLLGAFGTLWVLLRPASHSRRAHADSRPGCEG